MPLIQVGRHRLSATVVGTGTPVVVFESGFGGGSEGFRELAEDLAAETTVLTYDRSPYGKSSPATDDRTPHDIATDLRGLLSALGLEGPYVLVAHSSGGRTVRSFAAQWPAEVVGMVLIDSSHEDQQRRLAGLVPWQIRLREAFMTPLIYLDRSFRMSFAGRRSVTREFRSLSRQTAADIPLPPGGLGGKPLVVLTRATSDDKGWTAWHTLHTELAELSTNSRHTIATTQSHFIHQDEPALVAGAIRAVLQSAKTGALLYKGQSPPSA
jgi:pimeloyl-ACP methyl ester carboxylesterase